MVHSKEAEHLTEKASVCLTARALRQTFEPFCLPSDLRDRRGRKSAREELPVAHNYKTHTHTKTHTTNDLNQSIDGGGQVEATRTTSGTTKPTATINNRPETIPLNTDNCEI